MQVCSASEKYSVVISGSYGTACVHEVTRSTVSLAWPHLISKRWTLFSITLFTTPSYKALAFPVPEICQMCLLLWIKFKSGLKCALLSLRCPCLIRQGRILLFSETFWKTRTSPDGIVFPWTSRASCTYSCLSSTSI